ncbi:hypothetical protein Bca4012_054752 [Brassica carinata]
MDSQDHNNNAPPSPGGKSHVCSKCGWNYPNPHPSAKNRRAHKKICGTIKGFETLGSDQNLDLQKEHCLDDEQKTPSPKAVDERIGDISEEDVFADAVCEFSSSLSIKEKEEETAANGMAKSATDLGETQHCNKRPEVVQESLDVLLPVQTLENFPSSVEADTGGESSSDSLIEQSREAQGPHGFAFAVEEMNMNPPGEADYTAVSDKIPVDAPPVETIAGQTINTSLSALDATIPFAENSRVSLHGTKALEDKLPLKDLSIRREVPSPDKTEPQGQISLVALKEFPTAVPKIDPEDIKMKPEEGESPFGASQETVESETVRTSLPAVDPIVAVSSADVSHSETIPGQVTNTSLSALDAATPFAENAHVSLHGTKGLEEFKSVNPCFPETHKGEECETATLTQADNLGNRYEGLSIGREVPSPDKIPLEDKTEPHGHTSLVAVKEFPSVENIVMSKIDLEDSKIKAESSFGASQDIVESETVRTVEDPTVADSNADVSHSDLIAPGSELVQANVVAEENSTISELSSESSCALEHYVSPESVVLERDDEPSVQNNSLTETCEDSILQIGAEACESTDKEDCATPNQKLVESGRTEPNRVVGGLGVIQASEIDGNVKAHNTYAEVPVTIESNDHRDLGRLQNLSEAHIRSLVLSPLVTRDNTSYAISGHSEPENGSQSSSVDVGQSKNQEITTSWSTGKEQHVPLKNLLNEARSPRLAAAEANNIQRVSSILDQGTSPEEDGGWPERREVSQEWNSPAKYPVERKVKGRPFWVPFVCCSSAAK